MLALVKNVVSFNTLSDAIWVTRHKKQAMNKRKNDKLAGIHRVANGFVDPLVIENASS